MAKAGFYHFMYSDAGTDQDVWRSACSLREGYKSYQAIFYGLTELQENIKKEDEHPEDRLHSIEA